MSDSLRASVERLKESTSKLNKITDEAARVVQAAEDFLNKECSAGVPAYVEVRRVEVPDCGFDEITSLGYDRHEGKFRIVVVVGIDSDCCDSKPWVEWNRATKLESVKKLPELLERIADEVDASVAEALQTTEAVSNALKSVLKTVDRKGAK